MAERKIMKAVHAKGRLFRTDSNDEQKDQLNSVLTPDAAKRLKESGALVGDWSGNKKAEEATVAGTTETGPARAQGVKREYGKEAGEVETKRTPAGGGEALPAGFPARAALVKGGYDTQGKVKEASDEELAALDGVGDATVKKIRDELK